MTENVYNINATPDRKAEAPTWAYITALVVAVGLMYLGIPAVVWLLLSAILPAYPFGYWSTVGLYVAWRLVRGRLFAPRKVAL